MKSRNRAEARKRLIADAARLRVESLDDRTLLSGMFSGMHHAPMMREAGPDLTRIGNFSPVPTGELAISARHGGCHGDATELTATLADPTGASTATGSAIFRSGQEHGEAVTELVVAVHGATPSATLDVTVDNVTVGQVVLDENGNGKLELSSNPHGSSEQPLPADFPAVTAGSAITVGDLSGTLGVPTPPPKTRTALSANLADPAGADPTTGNVQFESKQKGSITSTQFRVAVTGATAGAVLDVAVDGTSVGQLTVDADGNGKLVLSSDPHGNALPLPANFPTVSAGSVITVGTSVTGTLATPSFGGHGAHHRHW